MRIIIFSDISVILKGMYNQSNNIDQDYILIPIFLILSILFFSIYSINAFTSGNVVNNWANTNIFNYIYMYLAHNIGYSSVKARAYSIKAFGVFTFLIALGLIIYGYLNYN